MNTEEAFASVFIEKYIFPRQHMHIYLQPHVVEPHVETFNHTLVCFSSLKELEDSGIWCPIFASLFLVLSLYISLHYAACIYVFIYFTVYLICFLRYTYVKHIALSYFKEKSYINKYYYYNLETNVEEKLN